MHKFHNNKLPQWYDSFFQKLEKPTVTSLDQLQTKITLSLEMALIWVKEI